MLVQSMRQLLPARLQGLSELVGFQHSSVPFILEEAEQGWDGGGGGCTGFDSSIGFDWKEVVFVKDLIGDGAAASVLQIKGLIYDSGWVDW